MTLEEILAEVETNSKKLLSFQDDPVYLQLEEDFEMMKQSMLNQYRQGNNLCEHFEILSSLTKQSLKDL